mgnify:FL=1
MYPAASDDDEVHWCFAVSSRDVPMRLVDARTGTVRGEALTRQTKATFAMVNHIEEYIASTSLAFSKDGARCVTHSSPRLFGGLTSAVALCPLATPGANRHSVLDLAPSQDSAGAGQSGIISALAPGWAPRVFDEENEGRPLEILAVGTFGGTIGLYVTDAHWLANAADVLYNEYGNPPRHGASEVVPGHRVCLAGWRLAEGKGITQLAWHPTQRNILVVAARRSSFLYVYDTGYLYGTSTPFSFERRSTEDPALLAKLPRPAVDTHQRFWFDLDEHGDYIVTGDECGTIRIWAWDTIFRPVSDTALVPPSLEWHAHAGTSLALTQRRHWEYSVPPWPRAYAGEHSRVSALGHIACRWFQPRGRRQRRVVVMRSICKRSGSGPLALESDKRYPRRSEDIDDGMNPIKLMILNDLQAMATRELEDGVEAAGADDVLETATS